MYMISDVVVDFFKVGGGRIRKGSLMEYEINFIRYKKIDVGRW